MLGAMGGLSTDWGEWVDGLRRWLLPPLCPFCSAPVDRAGECCPACLDGIRVWPRSTCERCGSVLPESLRPGPCAACLKRPPPQLRTVSLFVYRDRVREAILDWKLSGFDAGLHWLLRAAGTRLGELLGPGDVLVPVPMPHARMRKTGLHHAADLARRIATMTGAGLAWRAMTRQGRQPRQSALDAAARRRNLRRAFAMDRNWRAYLPEGARPWIVDDILTTGSTARAAAGCLAKHAGPVRVLTLARTPRPGELP